MHKISLAERILTGLTSREHAAATIGDLMEESPGRGGRSLFVAVMRIVLHKHWRVLAAVPVALLFSYGRFSPGHLMMRFHPLRALPSSVWTIPFLLGLEACWILLPYFAVRYGWRDTATQASAVVFVVLTGVWLSGTNPSSWALGIFAVAGLIFAGAISRRYRDAAFLCIATALVYTLNFGLMVRVQEAQVNYAIRHDLPVASWPLKVLLWIAYMNLLLTVTFVHWTLSERRFRLQMLEE